MKVAAAVAHIILQIPERLTSSLFLPQKTASFRPVDDFLGRFVKTHIFLPQTEAKRVRNSFLNRIQMGMNAVMDT